MGAIGRFPKNLPEIMRPVEKIVCSICFDPLPLENSFLMGGTRVCPPCARSLCVLAYQLLTDEQKAECHRRLHDWREPMRRANQARKEEPPCGK